MSLTEIPFEDFKLLFRATPGMLLVMSPDFTILEVSDAHLRATMTDRKDVIGRKVFDAFPDNPNDEKATGVSNLKASLHRVVQHHKIDAMPVQKYDIARPQAQGGGFEERFWSIINSPVFNDKGELVYILNRAEDVTEFVQLKKIGLAHQELLFVHNKQVEESSRRIQEANKELESFAYSVSHDLRAPLRAISGFSGLLQMKYKDQLDAEAHRLIDMVTSNVRKMNQLIDDLLEFSRLSREEMRSTIVDVKNMVELVFEELQRSHPEQRIQLSLENLPPIQGDSALLRQVWVNLLSNAIKYSRTKPESVIRVNSYQKDNDVVYEISDNGVGFDMKYVGQLFGVFHRLHKEAEFEGTGVGLAIVQQIIHRHNGKVWAEGYLGQGSKFSIALPKEIPTHP